tara:strand:- start:4924 stop:7188 length:2265 start_codon:yes stop_codon:yes gene_type:complete
LKIKIKRSLKERYGLSPTGDLTVSKLFDDTGLSSNNQLQTTAQQIESIFNKDLVFYDLETTGLRRSDRGSEGEENFDPSDSIHQIACLRYSLGGNMDTLDPEKPKDGYVAKCEITKEQIQKTVTIKKKRALILAQTAKGEYLQFKKFINRDNQFNYNPSNSDDVATIQALFFHIFINYTIKNKKDGTLRKKTRNDEMVKKILEYAKGMLDDGGLQRIEEILDNLDPSREDLLYFFKNIFDDSGVQANLGDHFKEKNNDTPSKFIDRYKATTGITVDENKIFTNYDSFPLEKYKTEEYYPAQDINSEKDALQGMMNYFDSLGHAAEDDIPTDGDYILVGQNINSFDNPFVLNRCKALGITNVHTFQNSRVYDTRFLFQTMIKYFKNLVYFYSLGGGKMTPVRKKMFDDQKERISNQMEKLKAASKKATERFHTWLTDNGYRQKKALNKQQKIALKADKGEDALEEYIKIKKAHTYLKQQIKSYTIYPEQIEKFQSLVSTSKETLRYTIRDVEEILVNLTMGGKPKGKLSTLMKAFIKEQPKQTHTADDDCEKLAMVLIPSLRMFYKIYEKTKDFVLEVDKIETVQRYRTAHWSKSTTDYYDPDDEKWKKIGKGYATQSQRTSTSLDFESDDKVRLRKKAAKKIYDDVAFKDEIVDIHKSQGEKKIINMFYNEIGKKAKVDELIKLLDMTTDESIKWYQTKILNPSSKTGNFSWGEGDILSIDENKSKNKIKIKVLRENKAPKNNKKFKKIIIKRR